ncbi:MAG TPA: SapC family protein [Nevskiaceae bacterium]|nr:SapC family protein [Nevskiaceae bacterium]
MAAAGLRLEAPQGYGPVVALDRVAHAGLGLRPSAESGWSAGLSAVFVNAAEFGKAALHYPLAFTREPGRAEYVPVALLGLRRGRNLFVDAQGRWDPACYPPAYIRRHPFCIAELPQPGGRSAQRLVCVEARALVAGTPALFDARGEPTAEGRQRLQLLEEIEAARQRTRVFTRRLEALDLLRPFEALVLPAGAPQARVKGLFRVDETALEALGSRELRSLQKKGELRAIYAHLLSLENFAALMARERANPGPG